MTVSYKRNLGLGNFQPATIATPQVGGLQWVSPNIGGAIENFFIARENAQENKFQQDQLAKENAYRQAQLDQEKALKEELLAIKKQQADTARMALEDKDKAAIDSRLKDISKSRKTYVDRVLSAKTPSEKKIADIAFTQEMMGLGENPEEYRQQIDAAWTPAPEPAEKTSEGIKNAREIARLTMLRDSGSATPQDLIALSALSQSTPAGKANIASSSELGAKLIASQQAMNKINSTLDIIEKGNYFTGLFKDVKKLGAEVAKTILPESTSAYKGLAKDISGTESVESLLSLGSLESFGDLNSGAFSDTETKMYSSGLGNYKNPETAKNLLKIQGNVTARKIVAYSAALEDQDVKSGAISPDPVAAKIMTELTVDEKVNDSGIRMDFGKAYSLFRKARPNGAANEFLQMWRELKTIPGGR